MGVAEREQGATAPPPTHISDAGSGAPCHFKKGNLFTCTKKAIVSYSKQMLLKEQLYGL